MIFCNGKKGKGRKPTRIVLEPELKGTETGKFEKICALK